MGLLSSIFGGGKSTTVVNVPGPSAAELDLLQAQRAAIESQTGILKEEARISDLLAPILYEQQGLKPIYDPAFRQSSFLKDIQGKITGGGITEQQLSDLFAKTGLTGAASGLTSAADKAKLLGTLSPIAGNTAMAGLDEFISQNYPGFAPKSATQGIIGFEQTADSNAALAKEIETGLLNRTLAALKGELPADPALTRQLGESRDLLRENLRKQLGKGFETSTPGIQALGDFTKKESELLDAARRGDLTLAEQLSLARSGAEDTKLSNILNRALGTATSQQSIAQGFGQAAQNFNPALSFFQNKENIATQLAVANAQARASTIGSLFGAIGTGVGVAVGMSDRRLKSNIRLVGIHPLGIGVYEYDMHGQRMRGVMADEVLRVKPEAVTVRDGYYAVDYGAL